MRYIEIILKLAFLAGSIFFIVTGSFLTQSFGIFLAICLLLGVTLVFNKDASYHFKQTPRDLMLRRIEGVLLVLFAVAMSTIHA